MAISQVVAVKVNGDEYDIVPPNAKGSGAGGNGGSVAKATSSSLLDGVQVSYYASGVFGSTVVDGNNTDKALSGGVFAYNNQKPTAKRLSETINGSLNDYLLSGAAVPSLVKSIHYLKVCSGGCSDGVRTRKLTTALREGRFNEYTGKFEVGYPVVSVDNFDTDNASRPSRSVPGTLVYKSGSQVPTTAAYKPKKG